MASLNEREWSCYKDGQFNGGSMVMLLRWPINGERMVILLEVANLMEGEWLMSTEVASLMEGEWSCYRGGQF